MSSKREVSSGSEETVQVSADGRRYEINGPLILDRPSVDKQGVRHVGGQLGGTDRGRDAGGGVVQIGLRNANGRKSQ